MAEPERAQAASPISATKLLVAGRYYAGSRFSGFTLEFEGDRYVEFYKAADEAARELSSGLWIAAGKKIVLVDSETSARREVLLNGGRLHGETGLDSWAVFESTDAEWTELQSADVTRYSVDGVAIGARLEQVEAAWGTLEKFSPRIFKAQNGRQEAWLDPSGRVDTLVGRELRLGQRVLLKFGDDFNDVYSLGKPIHPRRLCGDGGLHGLLIAMRELEHVSIQAFGFDGEAAREQDPERYEELREAKMLDRIDSIRLITR